MYGSWHYSKSPSRTNHAAVLTVPQYHSFFSPVHVNVMFPHRRRDIQTGRCWDKVMGWTTAETGYDSQRDHSFLCWLMIPNQPWDPLGLLSNGYRGYSDLGAELTTHNSLVPLVKKDGPCSCTYLVIRDLVLDQLSTEYLFTTTLPSRVAKCAPCTFTMRPTHLLYNAANLVCSAIGVMSETRNEVLQNYYLYSHKT
jgi:hypothetical protein